jgi:hypothetical protein
MAIDFYLISPPSVIKAVVEKCAWRIYLLVQPQLTGCQLIRHCWLSQTMYNAGAFEEILRTGLALEINFRTHCPNLSYHNFKILYIVSILFKLSLG